MISCERCGEDVVIPDRDADAIDDLIGVVPALLSFGKEHYRPRGPESGHFGGEPVFEDLWFVRVATVAMNTLKGKVNWR